MAKENSNLTVIGRVEKIDLPSLQFKTVPAKVDTGADYSSFWCSDTKLVDGKLQCVFFGPGSKFYTGDKVTFKRSEFSITRVVNSFGDSQVRFKVHIPIKVRGKLIKASFTLSDRSKKLYPILIGRATLRGKFLVDVRKGSPLLDEERKVKKELSQDITSIMKEMKL